MAKKKKIIKPVVDKLITEDNYYSDYMYVTSSTLKLFTDNCEKKFDYILFEGNGDNHPFKKCTGTKLKQSDNFQRSTRNPFNRNSKYSLTIYSFKYNMLPNCFKN